MVHSKPRRETRKKKPHNEKTSALQASNQNEGANNINDMQPHRSIIQRLLFAFDPSVPTPKVMTRNKWLQISCRREQLNLENLTN